jgi:hypothetical protein
MFDKKQFLDVVTELTNKKTHINLEGNNTVGWHFFGRTEMEWGKVH